MKVGGACWLALLAAGCVTTTPVQPPTPQPRPEPAPTEDASAPIHAVISAFIERTEARQFDAVLPLLAAPLRARYSVDRLARDFEADPRAQERLDKLKTSLGQPPEVSGNDATIEWSPGRRVRLTREGGSWRVAALE